MRGGNSRSFYHGLCGGQRRCAFDFPFVLECDSKIQHRAKEVREQHVWGGGGAVGWRGMEH